MLEKKVAVITGAGSGIGRSVATVFAEQKANMLLIGRDEEKLKRVQTEIQRNHKVDVIIASADVGNSSAIKKAIEKGHHHFGSLDILSHNAAIFPRSLLTDLQEAEWNDVLRINLSGTLYTLQAIQPFMIEQKSGNIVLTSSVAGTVFGLPAMASYAASKAGLDGLMKTAALELSPYHIRVNSVCPSATLTFEVDTPEKQEIVNRVAAVNPLKRWATPREVATSILFLASDLSSYINGHCLVIDGGQSALAEPHHISPEYLENHGTRPKSP